MKARSWIVGVLLIGVLLFAMRGCLNQPAPDQRLAEHFEALCDIARDNVKTPERGVRKLGGYLGKHLGEIFGDFGSTIATIEKIKDDEAHDERARVARDRIRAPWRACQNEWMQFSEAVKADPAASALMQQTADRLNRTIEILISSKHLDLLDLPNELQHAFDVR
jgi:hypothetical protein